MKLAELINEAYEKQKDEKPREYIGASIIGNDCEALIAFSLRGFPNDPIPYRLQRIFRDGHRIENDVIFDIKKAKVRVMEVDPFTGKQWAFQGFGGHAVGHADGMIEDAEGQSMLLEIKSMNDKKWTEFQKERCEV